MRYHYAVTHSCPAWIYGCISVVCGHKAHCSVESKAGVFCIEQKNGPKKPMVSQI